MPFHGQVFLTNKIYESSWRFYGYPWLKLIIFFFLLQSGKVSEIFNSEIIFCNLIFLSDSIHEFFEYSESWKNTQRRQNMDVPKKTEYRATKHPRGIIDPVFRLSRHRQHGDNADTSVSLARMHHSYATPALPPPLPSADSATANRWFVMPLSTGENSRFKVANGSFIFFLFVTTRS